MTATVERPIELEEHVEAPLTLDEPPPRVLGWWDQIGLWGNLGMSILGPVTAIWILQPATGWADVLCRRRPGHHRRHDPRHPADRRRRSPRCTDRRAVDGAVARVVRPAAVLPADLVNVVQLIGWSVFEIVVISAAAEQLLPWKGIAGLTSSSPACSPL